MKLLRSARFHFLLIAGITIFLSFNRHSKYGQGDYRNTFFSDRAGYYIILPSTFIYHFDVKSLPKAIDSVHGNGYKLDQTNGKIISKYPTGIALLESPFFITAHLLALAGLDTPDGFSRIYETSIIISTLFWVLLGLWLLYKTLKIYFDNATSILTIWIVLFATNLIHYATTDAGSSHAYSFFAVSWILFLIHHKKETTLYFLILGIASGLCVSTRYLLVIPLFSMIWLCVAKINLSGLKLKFLPLVLVGVMVPLIPDLIYHFYIGKISFYQGETFNNLWSPRFSWVLFAPDNGWLIYNPIWLLLIPGFVKLYTISKELFFAGTASFVCLLTLYACWYDPTLGCGLGYRGFVDIYPLLSIPLALSLNTIWISKYKLGLLALLLLSTIWNLKLYFGAVTCFDSTNLNVWNWEKFFSFLF